MSDGAPFYEPVSLGEACETKYQISRVLNQRLWPERSQMAFRYSIGTSSRDSATMGWRLFDWQSTPLEAVCVYIEKDFKGLLEFEDLEPTAIGVRNTRFDTYHLHDFTESQSQTVVTREEMLQRYPVVRLNFERLAADFRALLHRPGPYLYVVSTPACADPALIKRLVDLLGRDSIHQFHLLVVYLEGYDSDLSALGDKVTKAWRAADTTKPLKFRWEGHNESWDKALASFPLGIHAAGFHDLTQDTAEAADLETHTPATSLRQDARPPSHAEEVWRGNAEAVTSTDYWRRVGARITPGEDGVKISTPPSAWHYGQLIQLDLSGIDLNRRQYWARLTVADVRGRMLVGLYDPGNQLIAEEVPVDEGAGPFLLFFRVNDPSKTALLVRTGSVNRTAHARIVAMDMLAVDLP